MVVKGHFDGRRVVLDEPVPADIPADTPVRVMFEGDGGAHVLARIARLARPGGLPAGFSEQHDHYVKGTPRR
jgi:hypothetical protein